jgi:hypothetical protein
LRYYDNYPNKTLLVAALGIGSFLIGHFFNLYQPFFSRKGSKG